MINAVSISRADAVDDRDAALHELFEGHYRSLLRLAALLVDDRETAEDVVQDAFVKLHRAWGRIQDPDAAPAYLRSVVLNTARSRLRRRLVAARHRNDAPPGIAGAADEGALLREDQREVLDALATLPRRQRECLVLRYYLDLSESEIAATLGISNGSVKAYASRGLDALATLLEDLR